MKLSTFENRAKKAGLNKNSIAYKEILSLLTGSTKESRPDISNKNTVRVYTDDILFFSEKMGVKINRGNDAPRGGISGNYCYLTAAGKKQMIM